MRLPIALMICLAAVPAYAGQDAWACSTMLNKLQSDTQQLNQATARHKAMSGRPPAELCPVLTEGNGIAHRIGVELHEYVSQCGYIISKSYSRNLELLLRTLQQKYADFCLPRNRVRRLQP